MHRFFETSNFGSNLSDPVAEAQKGSRVSGKNTMKIKLLI